jgi:hypothetical protein
MRVPSVNRVTEKAIKNILWAMIKSDDCPLATEQLLAESVILLNQISKIRNFEIDEMQEQFEYCRDIYYNGE